MSFGTTPYRVTLLLASPQAANLWEWDVWRTLVTPLTPLLTSRRGRTSVRMHQYVPKGDGSPYYDAARFGPLAWNERSHQKWTHGSPETAGKCDAWSFHSASVWSPGPGTCEKEDMPPDGFLAFANERTLGSEGVEHRFGYAALVAARLDLDGGEARAAAAVAALREIMAPVLVATTERSWSGGKCLRTGEHTGSLTDAPSLGTFKAGPRHKEPPSLDLLAGRWRLDGDAGGAP